MDICELIQYYENVFIFHFDLIHPLESPDLKGLSFDLSGLFLLCLAFWFRFRQISVFSSFISDVNHK